MNSKRERNLQLIKISCFCREFATVPPSTREIYVNLLVTCVPREILKNFGITMVYANRKNALLDLPFFSLLTAYQGMSNAY